MANEVIVKSKDKKYCGKSLEELKEMNIREVAALLPSRSRRSVLRNDNTHEKFIARCEKKLARNKRIKTHLRDLIILPKMVGMLIGIHNGKQYEQVEISLDMIGHRLGEFSQTRTRVKHTSAGVGATKGSRAKKK